MTTNDNRRTKVALIAELEELRRRFREMECDGPSHQTGSLEDRMRKHEFILNTAPHCMTLISRDYVYEAANKAFCDAVGRPLPEIIGKNVEDIWGTSVFEDSIKPHLARCLSGEIVEQYQAVINFPACGPRHYDVSCNPYTDAAGEVTHAVVISRDISNRLAIEFALRKKQKQESIALLSSGIAHDFNNLLTVILGNISMAKLTITDQDSVQNSLDHAEIASHRARDLTERLMAFATGGSPVLKPVSAREVLAETVRFVLTGSNVKCELSVAEDLWAVEADESQLAEVIQNLVLNGVQAMPDGGMLTVSAENTRITEKTTSPYPSGRYVEIRIGDQGIGIRADDLSRIFDPYYTTKSSGRGLGLALSHSIVIKHGGYIRVKSKIGKGTVFTVLLPASSNPAPSPAPVTADEALTGRGRILIMDDDELVRHAVQNMVSHLGYEVVTVKDGEEAVACYKKALGSPNPFDVVILDLTVPGGLGGEKAVAELQQLDPDVRAVISSGYRQSPVIQNFADYGFRQVVSKPYNVEELSVAIRNLMDQPKPAVTTEPHGGGTKKRQRKGGIRQTILLVDDSEDICEVSRKLFAGLGYQFITTTQPREAIKIIRRDPAQIDLLITDQVMPEMTGTELARQVAAIKPGIPIILITGYPESVSARALEESSICTMIPKPLDVTRFRQAVHDALTADMT